MYTATKNSLPIAECSKRTKKKKKYKPKVLPKGKFVNKKLSDLRGFTDSSTAIFYNTVKVSRQQ